MQNNISIFKHEKFVEIRVITKSGEPQFIAKDICASLGIGNVCDALKGLDDDEKGIATVDTPGGTQDVLIVSEAGLYSLILRSRKPEAKAFKRWVTHEVLPSIRKTGGYIPVEPGDDEKLILAKGFKIAMNTIEEQKKKIAADAPKVATYDHFLAECDDEIPMAVLANRLRQEGLPYGLQRLYADLRLWGVLCSKGSRRNLPTQKYMDKGWFKIIAPPPYGGESWRPTLRLTPKGVAEITARIHELLGEVEVDA